MIYFAENYHFEIQSEINDYGTEQISAIGEGMTYDNYSDNQNHHLNLRGKANDVQSINTGGEANPFKKKQRVMNNISKHNEIYQQVNVLPVKNAETRRLQSV